MDIWPPPPPKVHSKRVYDPSSYMVNALQFGIDDAQRSIKDQTEELRKLCDMANELKKGIRAELHTGS